MSILILGSKREEDLKQRTSCLEVSDDLLAFAICAETGEDDYEAAGDNQMHDARQHYNS